MAKTKVTKGVKYTDKDGKRHVLNRQEFYDLIERLNRKAKANHRIKVIEDIKKAVDYIGKKSENNITILPTYTALLKINKLKELKKCY